MNLKTIKKGMSKAGRAVLVKAGPVCAGLMLPAGAAMTMPYFWYLMLGGWGCLAVYIIAVAIFAIAIEGWGIEEPATTRYTGF